MVTARLYIEGGGDSKEQAIRFRQGWNDFFARAGVAGKTRVVRGGRRGQKTFDRFATAIETRSSRDVPLLLVDSEEAVAANSVWEHLLSRDGWVKPVGAADQAFLMVQAMETWFLADRTALRRYFGSGFRNSALRQWAHLETVSKVTVFQVLSRATAGCTKRYEKGRISFELLARVDPVLIENACPHARALPGRLRAL